MTHFRWLLLSSVQPPRLLLPISISKFYLHVQKANCISQLYLTCFFGITRFSETVHNEIIPILPFWALLLSAYILFSAWDWG